MQFYLVYILILLFVYCKSDFFDDNDIGPEDIAEIEVLKILTEKLERLNQTFEIPKNLLEYHNYDISFFVYTPTHTSGTVLHYNQSNQLGSIPGFSTDLQTVFVIHGWRNSRLSLINTLIRDALLQNAIVNVVSVDWSTYSLLGYVSSVSSVPNVGNTISTFINGMNLNYNYSASKIILIGHSLGAHVAGFAGKGKNGTIGMIIGMDPAGPLYFESLPNNRLNSGDALYVQAIHTNAGLLGVNYNLGDADFWPNGGKYQPGCSLITLSQCSHNRSYIYTAESIGNNNFYARKCSSYSNYISGSCASNNLALLGGLDYSSPPSGVFYLNTSSSSPYALGDIFG